MQLTVDGVLSQVQVGCARMLEDVKNKEWYVDRFVL